MTIDSLCPSAARHVGSLDRFLAHPPLTVPETSLQVACTLQDQWRERTSRKITAQNLQPYLQENSPLLHALDPALLI